MSARKCILSLTRKIRHFSSSLDIACNHSKHLMQPSSRRHALWTAPLGSILPISHGFASASVPETVSNSDAPVVADSTRPEDYDDCVFDADDKDYKGEPPSDPEETYLFSPDDDD